MLIKSNINKFLPILAILAFPAHSSTYYYEFNKNITKFTDPFTPQSESLLAPYAHMSIFDENGGVGISLTVNKDYRGWLDTIYLKYIPELSLVPRKNVSQPPAPSSEPAYYYAENNLIYENGYSFSAVTYQNVSIFFRVSPDNPLADSFSFHFRNLPSNITASEFLPLYVSAKETYGWGKFSDEAYVLASQTSAPILSQVPETNSSVQLLLGVIALASIRRKYNKNLETF